MQAGAEFAARLSFAQQSMKHSSGREAKEVRKGVGDAGGTLTRGPLILPVSHVWRVLGGSQSLKEKG